MVATEAPGRIHRSTGSMIFDVLAAEKREVERMNSAVIHTMVGAHNFQPVSCDATPSGPPAASVPRFNQPRSYLTLQMQVIIASGRPVIDCSPDHTMRAAAGYSNQDSQVAEVNLCCCCSAGSQ